MVSCALGLLYPTYTIDAHDRNQPPDLVGDYNQFVVRLGFVQLVHNYDLLPARRPIRKADMNWSNLKGCRGWSYST